MPIDLYMEHLNCRLKSMIESLQSNVHPKSIQRVAKALGIVHLLCKIFQSEVSATINKGYVTYPSFESDFGKILKQLEDEDMFVVSDNRSCPGYNSLPLLSNININHWLYEKVMDLTIFVSI